tara:strand:+ start:2528 stop:2647 length:120 start_codon:yes stop_codon:yes gene_type:complete
MCRCAREETKAFSAFGFGNRQTAVKEKKTPRKTWSKPQA